MFITLSCFHCGKGYTIEVSHPPMFGFELAGWANDVGLLGVIDIQHGRSIVFCNEACKKAETTKKGTIRVRPKGIDKEKN